MGEGEGDLDRGLDLDLDRSDFKYLHPHLIFFLVGTPLSGITIKLSLYSNLLMRSRNTSIKLSFHF